MDKYQENELKSMLTNMRPADVKDYVWDRAIDNVITAADYARQSRCAESTALTQLYADFVVERLTTVIKLVGQAHSDVLTRVVDCFEDQLNQDVPDRETADREVETHTIIKDYDGYDVQEETHDTIFILKKPWRAFQAGQRIRYKDGCKAVGGYVSGHWVLA